MILSVDGQNQRKKYFKKYRDNINKSKQTKRRNKAKRQSWLPKRKISFWEKKRRYKKRVYCKD